MIDLFARKAAHCHTKLYHPLCPLRASVPHLGMTVALEEIFMNKVRVKGLSHGGLPGSRVRWFKLVMVCFISAGLPFVSGG